MNDCYDTPAVVCDADKLSQVATIQELGHLQIPVVALSSSPRALGFASRYVRQRILCGTPSYDPAYIRYLISSVPRGVLFCSNDANTENISRAREELASEGFRMLISDAGLLQRVIRKDRLYQTARECGISVPRCSLVSSEEELEAKVAEFGLPLILKSTNLAGGIYRFIPSPETAAMLFREMSATVRSECFQHRQTGLMVQQWIPQEEITLWNFNAVANCGEILSFSMGRRIRTDTRPDGTLGSVLLFGKTAVNPRILEANRCLLRHLSFSGIVETEWSESSSGENRFYLYDFNPRPSGNLRWSLRSGASLVEQYYRAALGMPPKLRAMRIGIAYAKVLYRQSDLWEACADPRLTFRQKLAVLGDDLKAVLLCHRHAVDVLDPWDLRPTLRAANELGAMILSSVGRQMRRLTRARVRQFKRVNQESH